MPHYFQSPTQSIKEISPYYKKDGIAYNPRTANDGPHGVIPVTIDKNCGKANNKDIIDQPFSFPPSNHFFCQGYIGYSAKIA